MKMDMIVDETPFRYDGWIKFLIGLPVVLMFGAGLILSGLIGIPGLPAEGPDAEMRLAGSFLLGGAAFILFIYWLMLPVKVVVHTDRLRIQYGRFFLSIPFETIESVHAAKGFPGPGVQSSVTSLKTQVDIVRKKGRTVRISPENREQFLDSINRTLEDWRRARSA